MRCVECGPQPERHAGASGTPDTRTACYWCQGILTAELTYYNNATLTVNGQPYGGPTTVPIDQGRKEAMKLEATRRTTANRCSWCAGDLGEVGASKPIVLSNYLKPDFCFCEWACYESYRDAMGGAT